MANRWGNNERLFFWVPKSLQMVACSHEIKWRLLLGRKIMTNLDSIFKSRDITLPTKVHLVKLWFFQWPCMDVRVGLWRKLSAKELMLLNCGVGEDSWEFRGLQGDPTSPFKGDQSWVFFGRTDAKAETAVLWPPHAELTHWKRLWCLERLGAGGHRDDREWDGWMASPTQWTWVWVDSGSWWWTGRPVVLQSVGSQRIGQDWVNEVNWFH